ncbi:MAG: TonB system transport protein ExbD [Rhizobiales bacterium 24-66-13]|jgi:biopolymer transport protein ExbD|uniref:TonB system transport protein ExbD n=1 Tax=Roseixanthobacter finlandensis TaxID=3119922 RepID=UPI000BCDEF54|nr:MAG: TonB system transport protein ExbD [Rhizobiales bacterium 12-66-7]OYZ77315.1 MAG: TonB system transport protein ExbD [Rhizobiales bacterium 24-66-13]HQS46691.1 TonB system transport protein ExbD [Xanthobacteraceae bacterium]
MAAKLDLGGDDLVENHEINVTPFIDVILVLLIIFMVAAPLATVDVQVDLPTSNAQPQPRPDKPLFLTVKSDLTLSLGNDQVPRDGFGRVLDAASNGDKQQRVFVRADRSVPYGDVMEVMNLLRNAGYLKVALVGLEGAAPALPAGTPAAPGAAAPAGAAPAAPGAAPAIAAPASAAPASATPGAGR